ncbi:MAG: hypothetical protein HON53_04930, partial [Planctomycetaceae bacterium]|nr:hypothetical protein [Planctomycetaceae bacterium]
NAVDELKIIGVRPKPPGIKADFTLDIPKDLQGDPRRAQEFARERVRELMDKGFGIFANAEGQPYLSAREGELIATTKAGVVYNLHFGNRFEGSLDDIEFGAAEKKPAEGAEEKKAETPQAGEKSDLNPDEDVQEGRYVLVRVELDKKSLGGEPVAPVEPTKPAEAGSPKKPAADAPKSDDKEKENQPKGENEADEKSADDAKKDGADAEKKSPEQTAYEQAMKDFTLKRFKFESDKAAYEKKVEEGQKQVNQLNDRFEAWYYVISAESFETLRMSRADLVKDKDVSEQPPVAAPNPSSAESAQPPAEG